MSPIIVPDLFAIVMEAASWNVFPEILAIFILQVFTVFMVWWGLSSGSKSRKKKLNEKETKLFKEIAKVNWMRSKNKVISRSLSFAVLIYLTIREKTKAPSDSTDQDSQMSITSPRLPYTVITATHMFLFAQFFGAMGLVDEIFDTIK